MRQTKDFALKLKALGDSGTFSGFASTYGGAPDLYGDVVAPGAFNQAIRSQGDGYPLLWAHDQSQPVGIGKVSDSAKGLIVDGSLNLDTPAGATAYSNLKFGSVKGLSIGYDCLSGKFTYDQDGVRTLNEVRLFEISLVAIPANPLAQVTSVKSLEDAIRVVRAAAGKSDDAAAMQSLRKLLKDLQPLVFGDDEDYDEDDEDFPDEKAVAEVLQKLALELKAIGHA